MSTKQERITEYGRAILQIKAANRAISRAIAVKVKLSANMDRQEIDAARNYAAEVEAAAREEKP